MPAHRHRNAERYAPADPAAFVADAERITNQRVLDGLDAVFAPNGKQITVVDGVVITARGIDEIRDRWRLMCGFMRARRLLVTKRLVCADDRTIVNEWSGSLAGKTTATGIEYWRFGADGLVERQRLYGHLNTGPDSSIRQSLRLLLAYPLTAATFARLRAHERKAV